MVGVAVWMLLLGVAVENMLLWVVVGIVWWVVAVENMLLWMLW